MVWSCDIVLIICWVRYFDFLPLNLWDTNLKKKDGCCDDRKSITIVMILVQISWIIEVEALNVRSALKMSDGPGWRFTSFKHSPGSARTKCQLSACHTNTSAPRSLLIPIKTIWCTDQTTFSNRIFSLLLNIFTAIIQTPVTFLTSKYSETKSHLAKAFFRKHRHGRNVTSHHFFAYYNFHH